MSKKRKRTANTHRSRPALAGKNSALAPPQDVIAEMVKLFNAGKMKLLEQKADMVIKRWPDNPLGWKTRAQILLMDGKLEDALEPLIKCVQLAPDDAQTLNNLGSVQLHLKHPEEAERYFRQALAVDNGYVQAHNNLGITLFETGRVREAEASYKQALAIHPDFAEAHNNLGNAQKELGSLDDAAASYHRALAVNPDFAEAHNNLGNVLLELGQVGEAKTSFRLALKLKPDYAQAHCGLADTYAKRGRLGDAVARYRTCIDLDPAWIKAQDGLGKTLGLLVPMWHVPMMNDSIRNDAYYAALKNAVTAGSHVLEIGTGSGLLAMMAARLGARKVTTCEAVPVIAETASAIIKDNGLTPPVTVIAKSSTEMTVGDDMDERADILVSEILSSEFLGEGVMSSIEDAKERLIKPGAQIIPARGSIQIALFGGADIEKNVRVDEVYGFDLSRFNDIVARKQYISRNDLNIELLSDEAAAFQIDFIRTDRFPFSEEKKIELPVRKAGRCCGIIQWLRLEMDDTVVFENHPSVRSPASGWQHCTYIFPTAQQVEPGQVTVIAAAHNRNTPWFYLEEIK